MFIGNARRSTVLTSKCYTAYASMRFYSSRLLQTDHRVLHTMAYVLRYKRIPDMTSSYRSFATVWERERIICISMIKSQMEIYCIQDQCIASTLRVIYASFCNGPYVCVIDVSIQPKCLFHEHYRDHRAEVPISTLRSVALETSKFIRDRQLFIGHTERKAYTWLVRTNSLGAHPKPRTTLLP